MGVLDFVDEDVWAEYKRRQQQLKALSESQQQPAVDAVWQQAQQQTQPDGQPAGLTTDEILSKIASGGYAPTPEPPPALPSWSLPAQSPPEPTPLEPPPTLPGYGLPLIDQAPPPQAPMPSIPPMALPDQAGLVAGMQAARLNGYQQAPPPPEPMLPPPQFDPWQAAQGAIGGIGSTIGGALGALGEQGRNTVNNGPAPYDVLQPFTPAIDAYASSEGPSPLISSASPFREQPPQQIVQALLSGAARPVRALNTGRAYPYQNNMDTSGQGAAMWDVLRGAKPGISGQELMQVTQPDMPPWAQAVIGMGSDFSTDPLMGAPGSGIPKTLELGYRLAKGGVAIGKAAAGVARDIAQNPNLREAASAVNAAVTNPALEQLVPRLGLQDVGKGATQAERDAARKAFEEKWQKAYGSRPPTGTFVKPEQPPAQTGQPLSMEEARKFAKMTDQELADYNAKVQAGFAPESPAAAQANNELVPRPAEVGAGTTQASPAELATPVRKAVSDVPGGTADVGAGRSASSPLGTEATNAIGHTSPAPETKGIQGQEPPRTTDLGETQARSTDSGIGPEVNAKGPPEPPIKVGNTIIPPPGDVPPIEHTGPNKKAVVQQFWNRTRNVIASQGPAGRQLADDLQKARNLAETTAGQWVLQMPTVRSLSGAEFTNFVDAAEGHALPVSQKVSRAVAEWVKTREEIYSAAKNVDTVIGRQENYFPHHIDPSTFTDKTKWQQAIDHLIKSGQAQTADEAVRIMRYTRDAAVRNRRQSNLEQMRLADLPNYEKSKQVLFHYIDSAANRIAQVSAFGKNDANALKLIAKIDDQGGDASAAQHLFDIAVGAQKYGEIQQKMAAAARAFNVFTKLGLGALTNAGQSVNTATVTGGLRTVLNTPRAAFSQSAKDFALQTGVTLDEVIRGLREGGGFAGKLGKVGSPGFNTVEKFNRTLAAVAGRDYARSLGRQAANGSKSAMAALEAMKLDPVAIAQRAGKLTNGEEIQAARNIVERTQFKVDAQDLPGWMDSPWGKVISQFRTFSYNQTGFVGREIIKPALRGNVKPLIRFLMYGLPTGAATTEIANYLRQRPSEEDPFKRIQQYFTKVGGLGVLGDIVTGLYPQNAQYLDPNRAVTMAIGTIGGPTLGTIAEGYGATAGAIQGSPTNLKRFGLRQMPVAGPTLQNMLLPYKPGGRSGAPSSPAGLAHPGRSAAPQRLVHPGRSTSPQRLVHPGR